MITWFVMTDEARTAADASTTDKPREQRTLGGPLFRLACLALFVMTLPFTWGQTASCNGSGKTFTGFELLAKEPDVGFGVGFVFVVPVVLGFVQYDVWRPWKRAVTEVISILLSGFATFYCFIATILSGAFARGGGRIYPAPLIATIAAFLMTIHAFRGAVLRVAEMVTTRRTGTPP
jgi:hypothetical protein